MADVPKTVTREEAIKFLECACRNWSNVPRLTEDDIGDVATELLRFLSERERRTAQGVTGKRPYPQLLSDEEKKAILTDAENLWLDLQENKLGGYSGVNRPFYILFSLKLAIEKYGNRDIGLTWSKDALDAAATSLSTSAGGGERG